MKWVYIITDYTGELKGAGILKALCEAFSLDYSYVRKKAKDNGGYPITYKNRIINKIKVIRK